ncbi:MAG: NADH-quinone oxidoreductase subunit NuoE [Syntrophobacterales bacterium]|nr:NADH-quinone oxidoreductase subunit NuoE [Syntrophobacterales bacterium]
MEVSGQHIGHGIREEEEQAISEKLPEILGEFSRERSSLLPILQRIQEAFKFLSPGAIKAVAEYLGLSGSEVYGVATFYNQFRFHPPGRHEIKICMGTACHVKGGDVILENFERRLGIKEGETTPDREYSIERVACVGCCALAPVAVVDDKVIGYMQPSKVEGLFLQFEIQRKIREGQIKTEAS